MLEILAKAGYLVTLLAAIPLGVASGFAVFFATAYLTSSIALLTLSGALALVALTGAVSTWAARGLVRRERPLRRWLPAAITGGTLLVAAVLSSALVLEPMDVTYAPLEATEYTRYWELPTGSRLAYMHVPAEGTPKAMPVIMLHGGPGAPGPLVPSTTDRLLAEAGFDVYHYHQLGAGLSERLDEVSQYTVDRHVADLEAIRRQLGAERFILVGGSWGGTLGAHYLAAYPERVAKAVFSSPGVIWHPSWSEAEWGSDGPEVEIITAAATPRFVAVYTLQKINPNAAHNLASDHEMSGFFQPLLGETIALDVAGCNEGESMGVEGHDPVIPRGFSYYANMITSASVNDADDPRPQLQALETPVLVLRGECDRIRREVHDEYLEVFRNATLVVIPDTAHSVASSPVYPDLLLAFLLEQPLPLEPAAN